MEQEQIKKDENDAHVTAHMAEWQFDNLPNRLTIIRILLVPLVILLLLLADQRSILKDSHLLLGYIAAFIFSIASITDFFDGYIARKRKIVTVFGSFLDPVADKFLVISSLIMLQGLKRVSALVVVVLVLRELYITSLRLLAREKGIQIPVDNFGKWKTTFQMIAIPALMIYDDRFFPISKLGDICIWIATILSFYSSIRYTFGLFQKLKRKRKKRLRAILQKLKRTSDLKVAKD